MARRIALTLSLLALLIAAVITWAQEHPSTYPQAQGAVQSVAYVQDEPAWEGACKTDADSGLIACVPVESPEGGFITRIYTDDGSATYSDGWVFDAQHAPSWERP